MTEQKEQQTEKKEAGIIKQIFKWFILGLLSLLLIISIIFQAPWKVIVLFAVFFLACTILPKPCRKYFWLCVGGVVIALIIWVFLPEENEGWWPYTFDEELAVLEAKHAIPDEENAAIIYYQLLEDYNESVFKSNLIDPNHIDCIKKELWSSEDCPEVAQWLKQQEGTIAKLIDACKIEHCRFPIIADLDRVAGMMHRLGPMQQWALLLIWSANNDIAEGRTKKGLLKYFSLLQMGEHLNQQSSLLEFLVGAGIERNSTGQLRRFVVTGDATKEHLNLIEKTLAEIEHDWSYDFPRFLEHEKLFAKNLCGMFYDVNPQGKTRLTRSSANITKTLLQQDMKDELVITYWYKRLIKASAILRWFYMPSTPQQAGAVVDEIYERYYAMAEPNFEWQKRPREFSISPIRLNYLYMIELQLYVEPVFYNIHNMYLRTVAKQRGSRLIIALRSYKNKNGNWPVSLDKVKLSAAEEIFVDPTNGSSFGYKSAGEYFMLYSKGRNNIDEDCRYTSDDWPIWPPASSIR